MSKITALITTLVLGTSSLAAAANVSIRDHRTEVTPAPSAPAIRDHRGEVAPAPNSFRALWVALSKPSTLDGRTSIRLSTPSRYSHLRLQATAGSSYVKSITVRFTNGTQQEIAVNKTLGARDPMINVDVSARASIDRIVVSGSANHRATFQLFGLSK